MKGPNKQNENEKTKQSLWAHVWNKQTKKLLIYITCKTHAIKILITLFNKMVVIVNDAAPVEVVRTTYHLYSLDPTPTPDFTFLTYMGGHKDVKGGGGTVVQTWMFYAST